MQGGFVKIKKLGIDSDSVINARRLYMNEDQYSDNFESYLQRNPIKEIYSKRIYIRNLQLMPDGASTYKMLSKSAEVVNDPQFNIS